MQITSLGRLGACVKPESRRCNRSGGFFYNYIVADLASLVHLHYRRQLCIGTFITMANRSAAIDFLRGVSILVVVLYHFVSWPMLHRGAYGVLLFFVISGYCIFFSIETSASGWQFYAKRLGRLMPALIACGAITTYVKNTYPALSEPDRLLSWKDYGYFLVSLPTLGVFQERLRLPDGAYWSLIAEFQFYAVCFAGISLGLKDRLIWFVAVVAILHTCMTGLTNHGSLDFFPFFICGMGVASIARGNNATGVAAIIFACVLDLYYLKFHFVQPSIEISWQRTYFLWLATAMVWLASLYSHNRYLKMALWPLAGLGVISYPLYLIHQDVGNMILKWFGTPSDDWGTRAILVPLFLTSIAWLVYFLVEKRTVKPLTRILAGTVPREADEAIGTVHGVGLDHHKA